jgi:hypothetical protein
MNTRERWDEITRLQCEIDNELQYNPSSAFWQRANALLQLFKYNTVLIERTQQLQTNIYQDRKT